MAIKSNRTIDGVTFDVMVSALVLYSKKSRLKTTEFLASKTMTERKALRHDYRIFPFIVDVLMQGQNRD